MPRRKDNAAREMLRPPPGESGPRVLELSTGSTLLNLANTGNASYGLKTGNVYYLVGDSSSGKTFLALTALAEASINPDFKDYRLVLDNPENGSQMDLCHFFGRSMADRLEPAFVDKGGGKRSSRFLEDFYYNLDDALKDKRPCIYVVDSLDVLQLESVYRNFQSKKKASRERDAGKKKDQEEKAKGSMGMEKAKANSELFRNVMDPLQRSGSILCMISQSRDNIGHDRQFRPKTRAGGNVLTFMSQNEMWSSVCGQIKRKVRGKDRVVGNSLKFKVKKNRSSGRPRTVELDFYFDGGFDDAGSCVNFLVEEGYWDARTVDRGRAKVEVIDAKEFGIEGTLDEVVRGVQGGGRDKELVLLTSEVWDEIEKACKVERKRRYD